MVVLAFLSDPAVVRRILEHLKLPSISPPLTPSRLSQDESFVLQGDSGFEDEPAWQPADRPPPARHPEPRPIVVSSIT
jgi:hypothetical protein